MQPVVHSQILCHFLWKMALMPDACPHECICTKAPRSQLAANSVTPSFPLGPQRLLSSNPYTSRICLKPQDSTLNMASGSGVLHFDATWNWVPELLGNSSPSVHTVTHIQRGPLRGSQAYPQGSSKDTHSELPVPLSPVLTLAFVVSPN